MSEEEYKPILLDVGCGEKKSEGWIGVDKYKSSVTDIVLDLDNPKVKLPFKDNEVAEVRAYHFFEHIHNLFPLINEIHRVLQFNGHLDAITPLDHTGAWGDPTHVRAFTEETWHYFTKSPPGNYLNPEIKGFWKILKNDWSDLYTEDTEKLTFHKRRELHAFLQPEKIPPIGWMPEMDKKQ